MNKRSYSLLKLGVIGLFRGSRKLQKAVLILAVLAFLTSLLPVIMWGFDSCTTAGVCITLLLGVEAALHWMERRALAKHP